MPAGPDSRLLAPSAALAGCVRAFYWHDLRPAGAALTLGQRLTYIPPGPYNGIVWLVSGRAMLVECGGQPLESELPPIFVAGAHRHPYRSIAITPYCSFGLVFQPAALALLSGVAMGERLDSIGDARPLLPSDWHDWLGEVAGATDHVHGYSDQPHFSREVKATYQQSPSALLKRVNNDDDGGEDWLLRL